MSDDERTNPIADRSERIAWNADMPLVNNRFMMADLAKVALISPAVVVLIIIVSALIDGYMEPGELFRTVGIIFAGLAAFLVVLMVFVMLAFFWNRMPMTFTVSREGVVAETGARGRKMDRAVVIIGALLGSPQAVGAGLLAQSQESVGMEWADVRHIDYYPRQRVISVKNSWRTVLRLYCVPENYQAVAEFCRERFEATAGARAVRASAAKELRREAAAGLKRASGWLLLAALSSGLVALSPLIESRDPIWIAFGACVLGSVTGGRARRFFGFAALIVASAIAISVAISGVAVKSYDMFGLTWASGFSSAASGSTALPFALSIVGFVGLLVCSLRNALERARLVPVTILTLVGLYLLGLAMVQIGQSRAAHLRAQGPELQALETKPWDSPLIRELKQHYSTRARLLRTYAHADAEGKRAVQMEYPRAAARYRACAQRIRRDGDDAEKQYLRVLDDALLAWMRVEGTQEPGVGAEQ